MTGHTILSKPVIEGVNLIDSEPMNMHRKVKEAIHIKLLAATLKRTMFAEGGGDHEGWERLTASMLEMQEMFQPHKHYSSKIFWARNVTTVMKMQGHVICISCCSYHICFKYNKCKQGFYIQKIAIHKSDRH